MHRLLKMTFLFAGAALLLMGCADNSRRRVVGSDDVVPPGEPTAVFSTTGDGNVVLHWFAPVANDLAGFSIYISEDDRDYYLIDDLNDSAQQFLIRGDIIPLSVPFEFLNGNTYYLGVTAFDLAGNESELTDGSTTFDTPRPFGQNMKLYDVAVRVEESGYDFSRSPYGIPLNGQSVFADIFVQRQAGAVWIQTAHPEIVEMLDLGNVSFDGQTAGWLSESDWRPVSATEAIPGHVYLVKIFEETRPGNNLEPFHVAKFEVVSTGLDWVNLDWAYQISPNNRELKPGTDGQGPRPSHKREVHR